MPFTFCLIPTKRAAADISALRRNSVQLRIFASKGLTADSASNAAFCSRSFGSVYDANYTVRFFYRCPKRYSSHCTPWQMQVDEFGAAKKIQIIYLMNKLFVQQCMLYTRFSILLCAFHNTTNCLSVSFSSSFLYSTLCLRFRLLRLSLSCPLSPLDTVLHFTDVSSGTGQASYSTFAVWVFILVHFACIRTFMYRILFSDRMPSTKAYISITFQQVPLYVYAAYVHMLCAWLAQTNFKRNTSFPLFIKATAKTLFTPSSPALVSALLWRHETTINIWKTGSTSKHRPMYLSQVLHSQTRLH